MFEILSFVILFVQFVAPVVAAIFAYKAYQLVKLERDIRIAREAGEKEKQ